MSTTTVMGNSDGLATGLCTAPPPPPPPPPAPGQVPAMRINTVEAPTIRRPQVTSNGAYEPPAAIQNAMLTKDKKPFTYTPGMGGKLDLSQIRSPRMARRVAKNANDEGIEGPPKSAIESKPTPPTNALPNLYIQPQVAIPVFPTNVPVQPPVNRTPQTPPVSRVQPSSPEKQPESPRAVAKAEAKVTPVIAVQPSTPESPSTPTQVTLAKAPTPWLQNKNKPQDELPEWAKRSAGNKQSNSSSPDSPTSPPVYTSSIQQTQQPPQWQQAQQRPLSQPAQQIQQQPQQYQYQQQQPQQFNQQQKRPFSNPPSVQQTSPPINSQERVIPIRMEDRPSVFDVKAEPGHHQFKQPSPHHQQRWGQGPGQNQVQSQVQQNASQPQQSAGGTFIIPITIEGNDKKPAGGSTSNVSYVQPMVRNSASNGGDNQTARVVSTPQRVIPAQVQQSDSGPVQSRSFRVLQKITDTDSMNDVDTEQIRKLQLSDDDRILMNKFKEQVDNDSSLHHEEDPRYRGAAIPSRAFRFLQNMTESGETPVVNTTSRPPSAINKKQNRNSKTFEETQANLPPSEQQVPEPKKYMGSAIPSRSFRILQAMTAPESVATQENRQADNHCQTENNVPGNQQGVYLPPCPPAFWAPDSGWWGYYPLPYPGVTNDSCPYHPDNTAYIYFPIYNQNYPGYPQYDPSNNKNAYPAVYPPYIVPVPPVNDNSSRNNNCRQIDGSRPTSGIERANIRRDDDLDGDETSKEKGGAIEFPQWNAGNSVSRTASNNSEDSDCTNAMNITDEEVIPERMVARQITDDVTHPDCPEVEASADEGVNVVGAPNYTYIDTSDSGDSTDTESQSDNESVMESSKISSDNESDDTSTDSDDSESYLAYSTGLNPRGRFEKDNERSSMKDCSSKEACNEGQASESSSRNNTDCDSDNDEQIEQTVEKTEAATYPHQLSVIYEDVERLDSESPRPQGAKSVKGWNETPFEATDDPPDDADSTTVSVSLPLRFKFSVSENNEDVTTVIVGDSTIKPERSYGREENRNSTIPGSKRNEEKSTDVSVDFSMNNEATVDFTLKRDTPDGDRKTKKDVNANIKEEIVGGKAENEEDPVVPHVNFTLRRIPTRLRKINCEETVETEFTVRRKPSAKKVEEASNKKQEERAKDTSVEDNNDESIGEEYWNKGDNFASNEFGEADSKTRDFNRNILNPEVIVSDCNHPDEAAVELSISVESPPSTTGLDDDAPAESTETSKKPRTEEDVDEKADQDTKHLLSVQNSREETDDEDSGVTSDMSRLISEVDTDSECTSSRNMKKYQRTQTHSRLFRLLNDDSILPEDSENPSDSPSRREYLSLPLKGNNFNYDDNYCSNYSSGITSPEYSPVCEQSWRRLHDTEGSTIPDQDGDSFRPGHPLTRQDRVPCKEDPYYQAWKSPRTHESMVDNDVVPSLAFKVLESRRPLWSYKVNVLCPRIKSAKNVPRTLHTDKHRPDFVVASPSNPLSHHGNVKTDHC